MPLLNPSEPKHDFEFVLSRNMSHKSQKLRSSLAAFSALFKAFLGLFPFLFRQSQFCSDTKKEKLSHAIRHAILLPSSSVCLALPRVSRKKNKTNSNQIQVS
mmetsp:Transcript_17765/g.32748  ORF Transcript_17765/g.32748 Transcript_17765/m.32748 type:complete len:102 (+) Transcript_17765:191-496(+)